MSFELSLFSSPSLELSSARLLYYLLHQSLDLLDLSFALDWLSPGRLLLSDVAEPWFTESSSPALELSDPREDLSSGSLRLGLPQRVQTPLSKRSRIVLPHVLKQCIVRVPLTKPPRVLIPWTKDVN